MFNKFGNLIEGGSHNCCLWFTVFKKCLILEMLSAVGHQFKCIISGNC